MKRSLFLLGLLSLAALASCKQEDLRQPEPSPRFYGVLEQPVSDVATKVHMDETNHFFWNYGDLLSIFYSKTLNRQFRFIGDNHTTAGGFERSDEDPSQGTEQSIETGFDYAIYPWHKHHSCDTQGNLQVVIPSEQEYYDDSFGVGLRPLLVARAPKNDDMFYFKHVGSYIAVRMKGDGVSVKSISFQDYNPKTLAGKISVSFNADGLPSVHDFISTSALVPVSNTISVTLETPIELNEDTEKVVWLVVPSIELSGYILTITDSEGGTFRKERTAPLTFERAKFYDLEVSVTTTPATVNVTGVEVDPEEIELTVDEEYILEATVSPNNATNKNVTWESENSNVATVDANGVVTAIAAGEADITVTTEDGEFTATCKVIVKNKVVPVESVSLDKETLDIYVGDDPVGLIATVNPEDATNKSVTWESSDTDVATVDENGKVTALTAGTATITVTTEDGNKTATCEVTVKVHVTSVSLDQSTLEMYVGDDPVNLTATVNPEDATNKSVTWESSDTNVATVDENGKVTAKTAGTTTITVTTEDGGKTATCEVTVKVHVTSVSLDQEKLYLKVDEEYTLTATVSPENATNKNVTWTSSAANLASVDETGKVTAHAAGTATITVTTEDGGFTATCEVIVDVPNQPGDPIVIGEGDF